MASMRFKLDRVALNDKCVDAGIYSLTELGRRAGLGPTTMNSAVRNGGGHVLPETARMIADCLGCKLNEIGEFVNKPSAHDGRRRTAKEAEKAEAKDPAAGNGSWSLQMQLLYKEQCITNDLLRRLVEIWEK